METPDIEEQTGERTTKTVLLDDIINNPADFDLKAIFADLLEEEEGNEKLARAFRFCAEHKRHPEEHGPTGRYFWMLDTFRGVKLRNFSQATTSWCLLDHRVLNRYAFKFNKNKRKGSTYDTIHYEESFYAAMEWLAENLH